MQIGQNIRQARDLAGLSQQEVADSLQIKRTTYANYESKIEPSLTTIMELAKLFNRHYVELIEGIGALKPNTVTTNLDRLVPGPEASLEQLFVVQRELRLAAQSIDDRISQSLLLKTDSFDAETQESLIGKGNSSKKGRSGTQK